MNRRTRLIFLLLSVTSMVIVGRYLTGDYDFLLDDFWFTSGMLLLILLSLVDQPHFSTESNIFINATTGALSLMLVDVAYRNWVFWCFLGITLYLAISSLVLVWSRSNKLSDEPNWIKFFSRINREIGRPEAIFSAFFIWGAILQFGINSESFNGLLMFWVVFMILNLPSIASMLNSLFTKSSHLKKTKFEPLLLMK